MNLFKKIIKIFFVVTRDLLKPIFRFQEVSILCYHDISENKWELSVSPEKFEEQIQFLLSLGYEFVSSDKLVSFVKGETKLPNKAILLSFDDGYKSNYTNALPILLKYKIPAIVFVLGDNENHEYLGNKFKLLNKDEIIGLQKKAVDIGFHTNTHVMLNDLNEDRATNEMKSDYKYFAYPGGRFAKDSIKILSKLRYEAAFCIHNGLIHKGDNLYALNRNVVLNKHNLFDIKFFVTKANDWYDKINK